MASAYSQRIAEFRRRQSRQRLVDLANFIAAASIESLFDIGRDWRTI